MGQAFPLVGRTCANGAKIRAILVMVKFVSAYVERDKKILKNLIFAFGPLRVWVVFSLLAIRGS